jgi:hypothetical protein
MVRKLLWVIALITVAGGVREIALASSAIAEKSTQAPTLDLAHRSASSTAGIAAPRLSGAPVPLPAAQELSFRDPLLSNLLLPLPPLLLPDLLFPSYDFPTFNSQRLDQELQLYSRYLRLNGPPDVLIVGSSRSLQGVDPAALETALAAQGYAGMKVYNFGINGATAQVVNLLLQQILTPEQMPRLILWADGSRAFNEGRPDITYNGILSSPGYQRLSAGESPIPNHILSGQIPTLAAAIDHVSIDAASGAIANERPIAPDLTAQGFNPVGDRYDPAVYFQQHPRVPGQFDGDYANFALNGKQAEATLAVARFAQAQQIPLVIVNLPLAADYIDAARARYEQLFRQQMQQFAQQEWFVFRDISQHPDLIHNEYFVDPSHINQYGARATASYLATDTAIPWQILQE